MLRPSAAGFLALSLLLKQESMVLAKDVAVGLFSDSSCKESVAVSYDTSYVTNGQTVHETGRTESISFNTDDHNWPNAKEYSKLEFDGGNVTGSAGANIFWDVPDPDPNCRYVMMLPWPQGHHSKGEMEQGAGWVAMSVDSGKCMFSTFTDSDTTMYWGQCCGDDCKHYSFNSNELLDVGPSKRESDPQTMSVTNKAIDHSARAAQEPATLRTMIRREEPTSSPDPVLPRNDIFASPQNPQPLADGLGQMWTEKMNGHWDDPDLRASLAQFLITIGWWNCKVAYTSPKWNAPGNQVAVGGSQPCGSQSAPCNFQTTKGTTKGSSVTWSEEKTHATTNGGSVGIDLGIGGKDGKPSAGITGSYEHSVTDSVSHSTGQTFSNTTSFSVTNTLQQQPGTLAMLTYFPNYECYSHTLDCGGGWVLPLDTCSSNDNDGDFRIAYIG